MNCYACNKLIDPPASYATTRDGLHICYACCTIRQKEDMIHTGRAMLYLTSSAVTNWQGTLSFPVTHRHTIRHNIARRGEFVQFYGPDNKLWYGKQLGDWNICRVRRYK